MPRNVALALLAACLVEAGSAASFSQPVHFKKTGADAVRSLAVFKGQSAASVPTVDDQGFWFSNFTIGGSTNLEILIDSGSSDAVLNPGVYKAGSGSVNTGKTFTVSYATTNPDGSGTETAHGKIYEDLVSLNGANLSVAKQYLGAISTPKTPATFPHDGLIGFAGLDSAQLGENPWIHSLCAEKVLPSCRFGLAFGTDGTGTMYYGSVPSGVTLTSVATLDEWAVRGSVTAAGKTVQSNVEVLTDSGTTVIFGPISGVKALFQAAGVHAVTTSNPAGVTGYYSCSNPPQLGFAFGGKVFNVVPSALAESTNGDNCTASIHGTNDFGSAWLVGQAFFQGKYIDHNIDAATMGFATLST